MDGEAGWWTTSGNIGLPPLARVMGVGRQQQHQKKLFGIVNSLLGRGKKVLLPQHDDSLTLARLFNEFFITKIDNVRHEFPILEQDLPTPSSIHFNAILDVKLQSLVLLF